MHRLIAGASSSRLLVVGPIVPGPTILLSSVVSAHSELVTSSPGAGDSSPTAPAATFGPAGHVFVADGVIWFRTLAGMRQSR